MAYELFDGENVISKSKNGSLTLTNYRLKYRTSNSSKANSISMMLEKVATIQVLYMSRPLYFIIAILGFLAAVYFIVIAGGHRSSEGMQIGMMSGLVGLVFLIIYFVTRKHVLSIDSDGGASIVIHTSGMKRDALDHFIEQIELAKHQRYIGH